MNVTAHERAMSLYSYLNHGGGDLVRVERMWHATFSRILAEMGFSRRDRRTMWDGLFASRPHLEGRTTKEPWEWLEDLMYELLYCCDRWTLGRLIRCHWLYTTWREYEGMQGAMAVRAGDKALP